MCLFYDTACPSAQVWDTRQRSCSHEFNVHEDYISDMTFQSSSMKLVATRFGFLQSSDLLKLERLLSIHRRFFSAYLVCFGFFVVEMGLYLSVI